MSPKTEEILKEQRITRIDFIRDFEAGRFQGLVPRAEASCGGRVVVGAQAPVLLLAYRRLAKFTSDTAEIGKQLVIGHRLAGYWQSLKISFPMSSRGRVKKQ